MREQMFKAYDNKNKRWLESFVVTPDGKVILKIKQEGWQNFKEVVVVDATLCRSTGLKDKNGVIIFEGDIIEYFINGNSNYRVQIGEIVYSKRRGAFMIRPKGENFLCLVAENIPSSISIIDPETNIQIIGNIFQNANLLEAKQ